MVTYWKAYKLFNFRFINTNFHRWMNSNRYIKRKNVCRNTLYMKSKLHEKNKSTNNMTEWIIVPGAGQNNFPNEFPPHPNANYYWWYFAGRGILAKRVGNFDNLVWMRNERKLTFKERTWIIEQRRNFRCMKQNL